MDIIHSTALVLTSGLTIAFCGVCLEFGKYRNRSGGSGFLFFFFSLRTGLNCWLLAYNFVHGRFTGMSERMDTS